MLASSGLSAPQFGLLVTLAEVAPITINSLAETMGMDRTTLTRNLGLLIKQRLVRSEEGEDWGTRLALLIQEAFQAALPTLHAQKDDSYEEWEAKPSELYTQFCRL